MYFFHFVTSGYFIKIHISYSYKQKNIKFILKKKLGCLMFKTTKALHGFPLNAKCMNPFLKKPEEKKYYFIQITLDGAIKHGPRLMSLLVRLI